MKRYAKSGAFTYSFYFNGLAQDFEGISNLYWKMKEDYKNGRQMNLKQLIAVGKELKSIATKLTDFFLKKENDKRFHYHTMFGVGFFDADIEREKLLQDLKNISDVATFMIDGKWEESFSQASFIAICNSTLKHLGYKIVK